FPAGDGEGNHDAVALAAPGHGGTGLFDHAHEFMAEDVAVVDHRDLAAVQVQVRAAYRGGGNAQQDVVGLQDDGVGDGFDTHVFCTVVGQCLHGRTPGGGRFWIPSRA